jgi:hypothetical protein
MPRTYLSICGDSAVGKSTLIRKLLADSDGLRRRFHIETGTVEAYGPCFYGDGPAWNERWREQIVVTTADVVLYQWQHKNHELIGQLYSRFPDCEHRVVLIWRPWEEHWNDYRQKHRATAERAKHSVQTLKCHWRTEIRPRFEELQNETRIRIELVNGSSPRYDRLDHWPEE